MNETDTQILALRQDLDEVQKKRAALEHKYRELEEEIQSVKCGWRAKLYALHSAYMDLIQETAQIMERNGELEDA